MEGYGMYEELELTENQLKLAKKVYMAIRKAGKAGVDFWDNYGTLACYNAKKIQLPRPDKGFSISTLKHNNLIYEETLKTFFAGNADDELFTEKITDGHNPPQTVN